MNITLPIPGFVSVVGLAVCRFSGDGVQVAPGLPAGFVHLSLFLLGKLFVGNEFFHISFLLMVSENSISRMSIALFKEL